MFSYHSLFTYFFKFLIIKLSKPVSDPSFLLRFLRAKKFSIPMAEEALERYILLRTTYGDLAFSKLDPKNPTMQELLNLG